MSSAISFRIPTRWAKLFQLAMVLGVLAAGPLVGMLVAKVNPQYVLIAAFVPLGLVGLQIVLLRPHLIPLSILITAAATTWYVSKGITPSLILTVLFTGIWLIRHLVLRRRLEFIKSPVMAPALSFICVTVISLVWGKAMADPLLFPWSGFELIQLAQLTVLLFSPAALILTAHLITTKRHLELLLYTFIGFTTIGVLAELLRLPFELNLRGLTSTWAVSLLYGQLLFNERLSKSLRVTSMAIIGIWLYGRLFVGITWLSGWVPMLVAMGVVTFLKSRKLFLLLLVLALVFVAVSYPWLKPILDAEKMESGDSRSAKWEFLFSKDNHTIWGHWLLGTGPFGYAQYFMTYFPNNSASTHSNYIDLFLQLGVVGCLTFIWLIAAIVRVGHKLRKTPDMEPFIAGFVNSVLGGLVALLVAMTLGDWFTPFMLNQGLHGFSWTINSWIFLGALVAGPFVLDNEENKERTS